MKNKWVWLLVLVLLLQTAGLIWLWHQDNNLNGQLTEGLANSAHNETTNLELSQSYDDSTFAQEKVVIDPLKNVVYMPEFGIKLPYNTVTKSIIYSMRPNSKDPTDVTKEDPEADVSTTLYAPPLEMTVINCSDFVRLKIESKPAPYNPHDKYVQTIPLKSNRSLQVYELINEKECAASWKGTISPATLVAEFKNATAY